MKPASDPVLCAGPGGPRVYTSHEACRLAGVRYARLDYWTRAGVIVPGVRGSSGSGSPDRLWLASDVVALRVLRTLGVGVGAGRDRSGMFDPTRCRWLADVVALVAATPVRRLTGRFVVIDHTAGTISLVTPAKIRSLPGPWTVIPLDTTGLSVPSLRIAK